MMATSEVNNERALRDALEGVETALHTPLISGELADWSRDLQASWARLMLEIKKHVLGIHRVQFQRIANQDPDLLHQVAQMAAEDSAILDEVGVLDRMIAKLSIEGDDLKPRELKVREELQSLKERGVALLTRIRAQEVAISVWFSEAFNRDLGVGG
jgi:hypothetical protein